MNVKHWAILVAALISWLVMPVIGAECAATFSDGITNSSNNGSIKFTNYGRLINNPDTLLATTAVYNNGFAATCTTADCVASGTPVPQLVGFFSEHSSSQKLTINGYVSNATTNDYREINVKNGGWFNFNSAFDSYKLDKLKVESGSVVYMTPGTYYIDSLEVKGGSAINVDGNGTVKIYARSKASFSDGSVINGGDWGDASQFFLYYFATGDDKIKVQSEAKVTGILYSAGKIEVKGTSDVYGAMSAVDDIHIKNDAWVTYRGTAIADTDFGDSCSSGPAPVHHFLIEHDGSGSTCEAETVTVKACLNANCSELSSDVISLDFTANGSIKSPQSFTGSSTFNFNHTNAETISLGVANTSVTPLNASQCDNGSSSSCNMVFTAAGCASGNTCATTFAMAANSSSNSGSIRFEDWGRLIDNPSTVLQTTNVIHSNSIISSCGSANCTASGNIVPALAAGFESNTSSRQLTLTLETATITNNDYETVDVNVGSVLNMSTAYSSYKIKKLTVQFLSTVNLTAGDYYIDELEVNSASRLNVVGSGTVRLYVNSKAEFKGLSLINDGQFGDAAKMLLFYHGVGGDPVLIDNATTFGGFIYSNSNVTLQTYGAVYGGVTAAGEIKIQDASAITYREQAIDDADFGDACDPSGSAVNHYRFEYDGEGLTCAAEQITIKACANANCSALYDEPVSITLGASTLTPSSITSNLNFTGSTTISLAESLPTTVSLSLITASPSADLSCLQNGQLDAGCDYKTSDTGFIFTNETTGGVDIPSQISGKPSDIGYHAITLSLQAVQTDTSTGACSALFAEGSNVSIDFAYQCEDPGVCSGNALQILNNGNDYSLLTNGSYGGHNIRFGTDSKAIIAFNYPDAGKIKLHAKKTITLAPGEVTTLQGSSKSITVRPFGFYMGFSGNPGATDATGGVFVRAGENFDMTLSAVQWQSGEDNDGNGQPDSNDDLSDNPVTANFGQEATAETATITTGLVSPASGHNPTIENNRFSAFVAGRQSKTGGDGLSWGDVGVVSFTAAGDGNYLDSDENISTTIPYVGRFVPAHFRLKSSAFVQACGSFSYMDQAVQLSINLQAQGVGDIPLLNYDSGDGLHGKASVNVVAENDNDGNDLAARLSMTVGDWVDGTINNTYFPQFTRLAGDPWIDGPYDELSIGIKVGDNENTLNIALKDAVNAGTNMNAQDDGNCIANNNCDGIKLHSGVVKFRYGRLNSSPAYGPATTALSVPIYTEYWNSDRFTLSSQDNCSVLKADEIKMAGNASLPFADSYSVIHLTDNFAVGATNINLSSDHASSDALTADTGKLPLVLDPPNFTVGTTGFTPVEIDVTAYPWLQFAWSLQGKGVGEPMVPAKNATFGLFRGNDRVIYWREKH